jgi:hypothetical protein
MAKFIFVGDIAHSGRVVIEAETEEAAKTTAEQAADNVVELSVYEEQHKELLFK